MNSTTGVDWGMYFTYDETSKSCLRRKTEWRCGKDGKILRASIGDEAGSLNQLGYYTVWLNGKAHLCHRVVYRLHKTLDESLSIDHIDGNAGNNKITNLRAVSHAVNHRNRKIPETNTSGIVGVSRITEVRGSSVRERWGAQWRDMKGKMMFKYFSISKYGDKEAFDMACEHRANAIAALNLDGAGYTETHGVVK